MRCESGNPCIMGCNRIENGYNFAYDCSTDTDIKLCFFDRDTLELKEEIPLKKRMGTVHSVCVCDDNIERMLYCYKADDEYIVDPYAKAVTGCEVFGVEQENTLHLSPVKLESFNWEGDVPLHLPYNDCVFYKLNVRGFTKSRSSKVKAKGTFRGIVEKIPYLKELGITTLEFMPAYEFDEAYRFPQFIDSSEYLRYGVIKGSIYNNTVTKKAEKLNCWGYTKAFYYAPKASYSIPAEDNISEKAGKYNDYTTEFKNMVKCLHNNGIEVVMEFFFDGVKTAYILDCVRYGSSFSYGCYYSLDTEYFSIYSDISSLIILFSSSNRLSASVFASSVLPTPVGPKNKNEPIGLLGSLIPALDLIIASVTLVTASSCPTTLL